MSIIHAMQMGADFTETEKTIAAYILKNPEELPSLTLERLASATYTSPASVIRMCKKLHTSGFTEFKHKFLNDLRLNLYTHLTPDFSQQDSLFTTLNKLTIAKIMALEEMSEQQDLKQLERIIQKMKAARQIDIFASSEHLYLAKEFCYHLNICGLNAIIYTSTNQRYAQALMANRYHVAFIIDQSGETEKYLKITRALLKNQVFCIGILENRYATLGQYCQEAILIKGSSLSRTIRHLLFNFNLRHFLDMLFVFLYVLDEETFEAHHATLQQFVNDFESQKK